MREPQLFLVDAAIESCQKACSLNVEGIAYSEEGSQGDGTAGFDLLPVTRRKTQRNHVFLSVFLALAETFYPGPESAEEFAFVNHD
jgi:hypothetical protein